MNLRWLKGGERTLVFKGSIPLHHLSAKEELCIADTAESTPGKRKSLEESILFFIIVSIVKLTGGYVYETTGYRSYNWRNGLCLVEVVQGN